LVRGQVLFGNTVAAIKDWTDDAIAVYVPQGLSKGSINVTVTDQFGIPHYAAFVVADPPNPVILVRGISLWGIGSGNDDNLGYWTPWRVELRGKSPYLDFSTPDYSLVTVPGEGDPWSNPANKIDGCQDAYENATRLQRHVESVREHFNSRFGYDPKVDLVGHSYGGLIIREYLKLVGNDAPVDKVIMLGTPNKGAVKTNLDLCLGGARLDNLPVSFFNRDHPNNPRVDYFLLAGRFQTIFNPLNLLGFLGGDDLVVEVNSVLNYCTAVNGCLSQSSPPPHKYELVDPTFYFAPAGVALCFFGGSFCSSPSFHANLNAELSILNTFVLPILTNNPPCPGVYTLQQPSAWSASCSSAASLHSELAFTMETAQSEDRAGKNVVQEELATLDASAIQAVRVDGRPEFSRWDGAIGQGD
jgi:pimeloyl-ACP methyl ester carboxylesterase